MDTTEYIKFTKVVSITSLPIKDIGPSNRMREDIAPIITKHALTYDEYEVSNRAKLEKVLDILTDEAEKGMYPIIIFDAHGNQENIVLFDENKSEEISWYELSDLIRPINVKMSNSLICIFSTCFGAEFGANFDILKPVPFYATIGPKKTEFSNYLSQSIPYFIDKLCNEIELKNCIEISFKNKLILSNCQLIYSMVFIKYVQEECSDDSKRARAKKLLINYMNENGHYNMTKLERISLLGKFIKGLEPTNELFEKYARDFLIGRKSVFAFDDIMRIAKN